MKNVERQQLKIVFFPHSHIADFSHPILTILIWDLTLFSRLCFHIIHIPMVVFLYFFRLSVSTSLTARKFIIVPFSSSSSLLHWLLAQFEFLCNKLLLKSIFWEVLVTCLIYFIFHFSHPRKCDNSFHSTSTWKFIMWSSFEWILRGTQQVTSEMPQKIVLAQ